MQIAAEEGSGCAEQTHNVWTHGSMQQNDIGGGLQRRLRDCGSKLVFGGVTMSVAALRGAKQLICVVGVVGQRWLHNCVAGIWFDYTVKACMDGDGPARLDKFWLCNCRVP